MKRVIVLYGPEPTGSGLRNVAGFLTAAQMCCGTTNWRFNVAAMNWESGVFRLIATVYGSVAFTEATLLPAPVKPMRSMIGSCLPAVRL